MLAEPQTPQRCRFQVDFDGQAQDREEADTPDWEPDGLGEG